MNNLIREKLKLLPLIPGVYIMKNASQEIIYVGKAIRLKNRVNSYFRKNVSSNKVQSMVKNIADFDYIICGSEKDALALECTLIKKHKPYYNILLKDGKTYPYIKIKMFENFPSISVTHKVERDGAKYFGPYMAGVGAYEVLSVINEAFPVRKCSSENYTRACIDYEMGRCLAPCINKVSKQDYMQMIDKVCAFLDGDCNGIEKQLNEQMESAKASQNYELAIRKREALKVIQNIKSKVLLTLAKDINCDFFAYASDGVFGGVAVGVVRGGKLVGVSTQSAQVDDSEALEDFIIQYYENEAIPNEIAVNIDFKSSALTEYLEQKKGAKVKIYIPQKTEKRAIIELMEKNALQQIIKANDQKSLKYSRTIGALKSLQSELNLTNFPARIECYDISHISGVYKVASMVVLQNGEPKKQDYRKFKIKFVEGNNDFASMREVVSRRLDELDKGNDSSFKSKPDLIIVDGGKGQLSSVEDLFIGRDIEVVSLAKRLEEVFKPNEENSIIIDKNHASLKLIQKARDEAHRFAITFHRQLRGKGMSSSILDEIEGIGSVKKLALYRYFKSYERIENATIEELKQVDGISDKLARNIKTKLTK